MENKCPLTMNDISKCHATMGHYLEQPKPTLNLMAPQNTFYENTNIVVRILNRVTKKAISYFLSSCDVV